MLALPLALLAVTGAEATSINNVVFVMAADGGVTTSGWVSEKDFVEDTIQNVLPLDVTKVGVVKFSTNTVTAISNDPLNLSTQSNMVSTVAGLTFDAQYTYMSDGILAGIHELDAASTPGDTKLMILISNGRPNPSTAQNPCGTTSEALTIRSDLSSQNISVLNVMVGPDPATATLGCLVGYDPNKTVGIADAGALLSAAFAPSEPVSSAPEPGAFGLAAGVLGMLAFGGCAGRARVKG